MESSFQLTLQNALAKCYSRNFSQILGRSLSSIYSTQAQILADNQERTHFGNLIAQCLVESKELDSKSFDKKFIQCSTLSAKFDEVKKLEQQALNILNNVYNVRREALCSTKLKVDEKLANQHEYQTLFDPPNCITTHYLLFTSLLHPQVPLNYVKQFSQLYCKNPNSQILSQKHEVKKVVFETFFRLLPGCCEVDLRKQFHSTVSEALEIDKSGLPLLYFCISIRLSIASTNVLIRKLVDCSDEAWSLCLDAAKQPKEAQAKEAQAAQSNSNQLMKVSWLFMKEYAQQITEKSKPEHFSIKIVDDACFDFSDYGQ